MLWMSRFFGRPGAYFTYVPRLLEGLIAAEWQARRAGPQLLIQGSRPDYVRDHETGNPSGGKFSALSRSGAPRTYVKYAPAASEQLSIRDSPAGGPLFPPDATSEASVQWAHNPGHLAWNGNQPSQPAVLFGGDLDLRNPCL